MTTPTPHGAPELPVVAALWKYIGPDPMGCHFKPCARALHEMDPDKPPYPESWQLTDKLVKLSDARAAIQQAAGAVPEGWKLVPLEPTVEMTRAAAMWLKNIHLMRAGDRTNALHDAYKAMLAAAPTPPASVCVSQNAKSEPQTILTRTDEPQPASVHLASDAGGSSDHLAACDGGGVTQPLTEERMDEIYNEWRDQGDDVSYGDLMRAVELAHNIKEQS